MNAGKMFPNRSQCIRFLSKAGISLYIAMCSTASLAQIDVPPSLTARIEVFTNSSILLTETEDAKIYYMDGLDQLERELSQGLPNDPEQAANIAKQRARTLGKTLQARAMNAGEGITRASYYGVNRIPAIVFDGKAIVYGVTNIRKAFALYEQSAAVKRPESQDKR